MTTPSILQAMDDACLHCGQLVRWVPAPKGYHQQGYYGYWYHPAGQTVFCRPNDEADSTRAEPVGSV